MERTVARYRLHATHCAELARKFPTLKADFALLASALAER